MASARDYEGEPLGKPKGPLPKSNVCAFLVRAIMDNTVLYAVIELYWNYKTILFYKLATSHLKNVYHFFAGKKMFTYIIVYFSPYNSTCY